MKILMAELAATGPLSIERLANRLGESPRTLQRRLMARGLTFRGLLHEVRHDLARTLLLMTDLSIAEIARRLGYRSPGSFTRAFTRWTGRSPSAFRGTPRRARQR